MFLYKISACGYESHNPFELMHDKKFSRKQLVDMYISCFEEAYRHHFSHVKEWDKWEEAFEDDVSIGELHNAIMTILVEKHGFKKLAYEIEFGVWEHIDTDPENNDEEVKRQKYQQKIRQALIQTWQENRSQIIAEIKEYRDKQKIKDGRSVDN